MGSIRSLYSFVFLACAFSSTLVAQTVAFSVNPGRRAPGGSVSLSISISSSGGAAPAALQWTMSYSATDVTNVTVANGSATTSAGKSISCSSAAGTTTCIVFGLNTNPIANGTVAQATVQSSAAPSPAIPITLSGTVASSAAGSLLPSTSSGGSIGGSACKLKRTGLLPKYHQCSGFQQHAQLR